MQLKRYVAEVVVHSHYMRKTQNDIALLHLEKIPDNALFAQMPVGPPKVGQVCQVLGWGELFADGPYIDYLVYADVAIMSQKECKIYFPKLPKDIFCATGVNISMDTCRGDSGGPLFCNGRLQGIIAWGYRCSGQMPSIFTNVYHHRNWIYERASAVQRIMPSKALLYLLLQICVASRAMKMCQRNLVSC